MGLKVRQLRRTRGITQRQLSRETGIAQSTLSRVERGDRDAHPRTLRTLSRYFGVTIAELMGEEPPSPKAEGPTGVVSRLLLDGPGTTYLLQPVDELRAEADGMSVPAILVRVQDLGAESARLRAARFEEYPEEARATPEDLRATRRAIQAARRGLVPRVMALAGVAEEKVDAARLADDELERAIEDIERGAAQALAEGANVPA